MSSKKNKMPRVLLSVLLSLCLLLSMTVPALAVKAAEADKLVQCDSTGVVTDHTAITGVNLPVVFDDNPDYYPISVDAAVYSEGASVSEMTGLAPDSEGDLEIGLGTVTNYDYDTVYEIKYRGHYGVVGEGTEIVENWQSAGLYFTVEAASGLTDATLTAAVADGAADTATSTKIDLTFDTAIAGLTADDITITDGTGAAVKGALSGSGTNWSIALDSVTTQGDVSVAVTSPEGYIVSGSPKTVAVYKEGVITNATITPDTGSFDQHNPEDVQAEITWNSANAVIDVKVGSTSIGTGNYSVSGDIFTIQQAYLATQAAGSLVLTIEFDQGAAAVLTIDITDTTPPTISPAHRSYDLNAPDDVTTTIVWNSTATVTDVVYGSDHLTTPDTFIVSGSDLVIKNDYLSGLSLSEGDELEFDITFNTGAIVTLEVHVVDNYTPSGDADLSDIQVGGTTVSGFDPDHVEYDVELPYGTQPGSAAAWVGATANDSFAQVDITQTSNLPGSATVVVTAEDNITIKTYTINFTLGAAPTVSVASITVTGTGGVTGVEAGSTLQMLAAVLPGNATNKNVTWSIVSGSGASIDTGGLLTATTAGSVTVRATAQDGSSVYGERVITVTAAPPAFIAVTNITGVPIASTAGVNLTLTGTVTPSNATNTTIAWSVKSADGTGAEILGNILSITGAGTVVVTATITNGASETTNYTQDFTITVSTTPVTTYTVTFNNNGSVYATKTVNAGQSIGSADFPADPTRSSYTFRGWFTGKNGTGTEFTSTTPVNAATTVYAKWTYSGGSGGSGDGGSSYTPRAPAYNADVKAGNGSETTLPVTVNKDNGSASIDIGSQKLTSGGIVITIPSIPDVDTYSVSIPVPDLSTLDAQGTLTLHTDNGSVTVPSNMLTGASGISGSKAEITIGQGDKSALPEDVKAAIGDRILVQLTLSIDGKQTDWSNPGAPVTVSIPYTPEDGEDINAIVIWYIDGDGNLSCVTNGSYDPETGMVTFTTTHFSLYAVGYNGVSYADVADTAWYCDAVSYLAARGITSGTGDTTFSPDATLIRGQFITLLLRSYGIEADENAEDNFSDAGDMYYTGYLAAAKRLGISNGVGDNRFAPEQAITRQEMFTLLYNALKVIGQLPQGDSGKTFSDFADSGSIAAYAQEAIAYLVEAGVIGGSDGLLTPTDTTTRAEMAQVLYNLLGE